MATGLSECNGLHLDVCDTITPINIWMDGYKLNTGPTACSHVSVENQHITNPYLLSLARVPFRYPRHGREILRQPAMSEVVCWRLSKPPLLSQTQMRVVKLSWALVA